MKYLPVVLLLLFMSSCDNFAFQFIKAKVNSKDLTTVHMDCGEIKLRAEGQIVKSWGRITSWPVEVINIYEQFDGENYEVFPDSLDLVFPNQDYQVKEKQYYHHAALIQDKSFKVERGDSLMVKLLIEHKKKKHRVTLAQDSVKYCMIQPCGYIKCRGNNIIKDTVKINYRDFYHYTVR